MGPLQALKDNLGRIAERIKEACDRAGRAEDSVTLVVVTKTVNARAVKLLYELGVKNIGENRVQDALRKADELRDCEISWHMVGHLQRNKVKAALGLFDLIHSVDSRRLADEIQKGATKRGRPARALMEVNVSGEESKFGIRPEEVQSLAEYISSLDMISLEGLMTIAPIVESREKTRPWFAALKELRDRVNECAGLRQPLRLLSMGMTQDFEVAVEEGTDMVRIGSGVLAGLPEEFRAG